MGEPIRVLDLAHKMIELAGLSPVSSRAGQEEILVEIVGLRPGEKLYEELLISGISEPTRHSKIYRAAEECKDKAELLVELSGLEECSSCLDADALRLKLRTMAPEYNCNDVNFSMPIRD